MKLFAYLKSINKIINHKINKDNKIKTIFRLVWWKINQLFFKFPAIIEIAPGIKCICYPDSSYGGLLFYMKWPDYDEMKFVFETLSKNDIFIDVGSNIGDYSLLASSKITTGKIYAFEPDTNVVSRLYENLRLNDLIDKVFVEQKIVGNKNKKIEFEQDALSELSHIGYAGEIKKKIKSSKNKLIDSVTLDKFVQNKKILKIKLLKIDVEGAELVVLNGSQNLLKEKLIDYIVYEINKNCKMFGNTPQDTVHFLEKYGYRSYFFSNGKLEPIHDIDLGSENVINLISTYKKNIL